MLVAIVGPKAYNLLVAILVRRPPLSVVQLVSCHCWSWLVAILVRRPHLAWYDWLVAIVVILEPKILM